MMRSVNWHNFSDYSSTSLSFSEYLRIAFDCSTVTVMWYVRTAQEISLVAQLKSYVSIYLYMCQCICIDMYIYVYEYDCFMYVSMFIYCVCMYFMTMHSTVLNCVI